MTPRFAAIVLPELKVELARAELRGAAETPLAVVMTNVAKDERLLLGNTRLDDVSEQASALGVRRGQTIAAARARTAGLSVRVVHVGAATKALESLAEMALAFGISVSFEMEGAWGDVLWCDVTGCAHLHGTEKDPFGEETLAARLYSRVKAMGHACRIAISDGPRLAAAVARFATPKSEAVFIVPLGKGALALRRLPVRALPLAEDTVRWLTHVGMRTVEDLAQLPRRSLGTRLGAEAADVLDLLDGDDRVRLRPYVPPEIPREEVELEYGIETSEALVFVLKRLSDRLALRLAGRFVKARRLDLTLHLDRALLREEGRSKIATLALKLPLPLATMGDLLCVLRARIDAYVVETPILGVCLEAKELVQSEGDPLDLFEPEAKAERALPRMVAEIAAELGEDRVGTLELRDAWLPEERTCLAPLTFGAGARAHGGTRAALLSGGPEPSRVLLAPPHVPLRNSTPGPGGWSFTAGGPEVQAPKLLEKLESIQWWKRGFIAKVFALGWMAEEGAMGWIEVEAGEIRLRGWMD